MRAPFSPQPLPHLLLPVFVFVLITAILTGVRWHLVLLICISLVASEVEHVSVGHLSVFLGEASVQVLCLVFHWIVC